MSIPPVHALSHGIRQIIKYHLDELTTVGEVFDTILIYLNINEFRRGKTVYNKTKRYILMYSTDKTIVR